MMKKLSTILVSLPSLFLVVGCYSPDLSGEGGFTCSAQSPACPEGFTCNTSAGVCQKGGSSSDGGTTDTTSPDTGPPPPTNWSCRPLAEPANVVAGVAGKTPGESVAAMQFGLAYYAPAREIWASFRDDNVGINGGNGVAVLSKVAREGGWRFDPAHITNVGENGGAHSDLIALDERDTSGGVAKKVIVAYQTNLGLGGWDVLASTSVGQNPRTVHSVPNGGYFPQLVQTIGGVGVAHAAIDANTSTGVVWYLPPPDETDVFVPTPISDFDENLDGLGLAAVGVVDPPSSEAPLVHMSYYTRYPDGVFARYYASYGVMDAPNGAVVDYWDTEQHVLAPTTGDFLGVGIALDGETAMAAYVYSPESDPEGPLGLHYGPADDLGEPVEFPIPASAPALAIANGHVAIVAFDADKLPQLAFRGQNASGWNPPLPVVPSQRRDLAGKGKTRPRVVVTGHSETSVDLAIAYLTAQRSLMFVEMQCSYAVPGI